MKRLLMLLAILALPAILLAQHISVASFRALPTDMTARITDPVKDQNGDKCALIKVVTTETDFAWEGGMLGVMKAEKKKGEYWVYVPYGAKKLTIKHDKLGVLRNYLYPEPIEEATVYEMVLTTGKVTTIVEEYEIPTQWVIIQSEPAGANVYLNDQHKGVTPFQLEMEEGHYTYRIDMPLYHPEAGVFDLAEADGKKRMNISLKPNFGYVQINTSPEDGATVYIDGQLKAQKSPMKTERLKSGSHQIKVEKSMFYPAEQQVLVEDGQTKTLNLTMQPAFGGLYVTSSPESGAKVLLDGNPTGKTTPCTLERLSSGEHTISLQKEWYQPAAKRISLKDGESANLEIVMQPTFGTVEVSTIEGAGIYVDGERKSSENWNGRLIAGFHTIEARKDKHHSDKQKTEVQVGETHPISLHPQPKQGNLKIVTTPFDAQISLNGTDYGLTPNTIKDLLIGDYQLSLSKEGYGTFSKTISIAEGETLEINEELPSGKEITISSEPSGATLSIDGQSYGTTPWTGTLAFGSHEIKLVNGKKTVNQQITISQNGQSSFSYDVSEFGENFTEGLVGYWSFDDGTANDQSGNNHNGVIHGSVPFSNGDHGKYVTFNGNFNNYIKIPHHKKLNFSNSFSICLWMKILSKPTSATVISKGRDIYSTYALAAGGRTFSFSYNNKYNRPSSSVSVSAEEFPINEWHHVACVVDNEKKVLKYYLDGQLMSENPITGAFNITTTYPLVFGRHFTYSTGGSNWPYPCNASIDEVRIYNRTLTKTDINKIVNEQINIGQNKKIKLDNGVRANKNIEMTSQASGSQLSLDRQSVDLEKGLVAHYSFDGNAKDKSGKRNDGILPSSGVKFTEGKFGQAAKFYKNCHIKVPNNRSLKFYNEVSFSVWVNTNKNDAQAIFAKRHDRSGFYAMISISDGKFHTWFGNNAYSSPKFSISGELNGSYKYGDWVHIVYVIANNRVQLYLNGKLIKTESNLDINFNIANANDLYLGKFNDSWYPFSGTMDGFRIYNKALDRTEVESLYMESK